MSRVFSGVRPSGRLHLGNYLGAVKSWLELQNTHECIFAVVDYHGITTPFEPKTLQKQIRDVVLDYLAAGLDPDKAKIIVQSQVPEHTELAWILGTITPISWLERIPTFKEKRSEHPEYINLGLLAYPVLMAADILIYRAEKVPVGEDQLPHIEMTNQIAKRMKMMFGYQFPKVEAVLSKGPRIMSLSNPLKKMSKTGDESIALSDSPEQIRKTIGRAVTDSGPTGAADFMSPGVKNLFTLMEIFSGADTTNKFREQYKKGSIKYEQMKKQLAEDIIKSLEPVRKRRAKLEKDPKYIDKVLFEGAEFARPIAQETLKEVKKAMGLIT